MEIVLFDYLATFIHAAVSFVMWLAVITGTAAVLVYNRVTKELLEKMHLYATDDTSIDADNRELQRVRAEREQDCG